MSVKPPVDQDDRIESKMIFLFVYICDDNCLTERGPVKGY